ncbi:Uma2 family endonuclease [Streptacidiphilus sp. PAMC 29251]
MDPRHFQLLEQARAALPPGFKSELSGDTIVMMVSPSGIHQRNLALVMRQFERHAPDGYLPSGNSDLQSPAIGKSRNPDLTYLPADAMATTDNAIAAEEALIAVELVSPSNPENDWTGKVRDYPVMRIPLYLIIDAREATITLFSEPEGDRYHTRTDRKFGEQIHIPAPFAFDLDTSDLLQYHNAPT